MVKHSRKIYSFVLELRIYCTIYKEYLNKMHCFPGKIVSYEPFLVVNKRALPKYSHPLCPLFSILPLEEFVFLLFFSQELHQDWKYYYLAFDCFVHIKHFFRLQPCSQFSRLFQKGVYFPD
jgi:hypothetical protein